MAIELLQPLDIQRDEAVKDKAEPTQETPRENQEGEPNLLTHPRLKYWRYPQTSQWGNLPPGLQQAIDNTTADDVPLRYRRWLVEYHRPGRAKDRED